MQKISTVILLLLLAVAGIAWWKTAPPTPRVTRQRAAALAAAELVDQSTYTTAQRLARLAETPEEQSYAESALRVADHALTFAFTTALRDAEAHPPVLSPEALKIQDRIRKSQGLLDADQQRVTQLTGALAQAKQTQKDALQDDLDLAQSQLELDKDELEEANQELIAAGGNPQKQIEAMEQEHEAQDKTRTMPRVTPSATAEKHGSWSGFVAWLHLRQKQQELDDALASSQHKAADLTERRAALSTSLENTKSGIAELSQHTNNAGAQSAAPGPGAAAIPAAAIPAAAPAAAPLTAPRVPRTREDTAALLNRTKVISADQKVLTLLDRRISDQKQLVGIYSQWSSALKLQSHTLMHGLLFNALIVIVVLIALLLLDQWAQHLLNNPKLDRRQVETLRSIARVALRVIAVVVILLIVIGIPTQFGTMIGIVGAGLTVALKDFIVAFFGWLMLMGRNGIRLGDWVEINGVSGEVTELGMFHTVLMETGNWSDAGHPTGRRVTFTNSFAIEGHYFNFSTSGQWLWDELQVVVPAGRDPYPIVDAITQQVTAATAESARQAEQEWQRAVPAQRGKIFSGMPGVNVKPVVGGVEIAIRYITRANERFLLRAKMYQAAVDLLGERSTAAAHK
ncbi:MAG TPA: mechanosensitive ion channel domain-containing protein [Steroidobacteraceae bacterium]|nr:mechanosensitive ion channel domain-containing protein [Steroidobacteraceae bacterium]